MLVNSFESTQNQQQGKMGATGVTTDFGNVSFGKVQAQSVKTVYVRKVSDMLKVISKECGAKSWNVAKAHSLKTLSKSL